MKTIRLYREHDCPLCEDAKALLHILALDDTFEIEERYIQDNDAWVARYHLKAPVIEIDGVEIYGSDINIETIDKLL